MKLAIAQLATPPGDIETSLMRMLDAAQSAHEQGADLIVYGFATLCGASALDYSEQEGFATDVMQALDVLEQNLACPALVPISFELNDVPYNDVFYIDGQTMYPINLSSLFETPQTHFDLSALPSNFEFMGKRFSFASNYDELDSCVSNSEHTDVIVYTPHASFSIGDEASALGSALSESRYIADATKAQSWLVGVGSLGLYSMQCYSGSSFVLNPQGKLVVQAPSFEEQLVLVDIEDSHKTCDENSLSLEVYDRSLLLWNALCFSLRCLCEQAHISDVLISIKPCLESHLLAVLSCDALGPCNVHAILEKTNDPALATAAQKLVSRIHLDLLDENCYDNDGAKLFLSHYAKEHDVLILGEKTKTSLALGDVLPLRVSELLPLGDVYLNDVLGLARLRNTMSPVLAPDVIKTFFVPDLAAVQACAPTDEERIQLVDTVLTSFLEWELSVGEISSTVAGEELTEAIIRLLQSNKLGSLFEGPVLIMSTKSLLEIKRPAYFAWVDTKRQINTNLQEQENVVSLLERELTDTLGSNELFKDHKHEMQEALWMLKDFSQGGAMRMKDKDAGAKKNGPQMSSDELGGFWGKLFSDN